jgi:hypothetical protein
MMFPSGNAAIDDGVREMAAETRRLRAAEERAYRRTGMMICGTCGALLLLAAALSLIQRVEGLNREPTWFKVGMTACQWTLFAGLGGGAAFGVMERYLRPRPRVWAVFSDLIVILLLAGVAMLLVLPAARVLSTLAGWIAEAPPVLAGGTVLALGLLLFGTRYALRAVYGFVEVVVGVVVGTTKLTAVYSLPLHADWKTFDLALGVLCAGVYLVVRGLDNIHVGFTKDPRDPVAALLLSTLALLRSPERTAVSDKPPQSRVPAEYPPAA